MMLGSLLIAFTSRRVRGRSTRQVYSERAFRHFLLLERRRTLHSTRGVLLALVKLENGSAGPDTRMSPEVADVVFSTLGRCVRAVDFIGWYRKGRVAAAVLAQEAQPPDHVTERLTVRVTQALRSALPRNVSSGLHVRILHAGRRTNRN